MLSAEQPHGVGFGTQESNASFFTQVHKLSAFTEETIAWMHSIAPTKKASAVMSKDSETSAVNEKMLTWRTLHYIVGNGETM